MKYCVLSVLAILLFASTNAWPATCEYLNLDTKENISASCTSGSAGIAIDTNPHLRRFSIEEIARQGEWAIVKFNGKKGARYEINRCHFSYSTEDLKEFLTIDSCQKAAESNNRSDFMTAGGAWVGRWHIGDAKVCKGKPGETEGLLVYSSTKAFGYENECDIKKVQPRVTGVELTLSCSGEGESSVELEGLDVVNGKLVRTIKSGRKQQRFSYSRCP